MAFNRSNSGRHKPRAGFAAALAALMQAEKLMQIALRAAVRRCLIGWLLGGGWTTHLHQKWIEIAGDRVRLRLGAGVRDPDGDCGGEDRPRWETQGRNGSGKGNPEPEIMTQETHPIVDLTDADLEAMLRRALRNTLILGVIASLAVLIGAGWRSGAMLLTGTLISAASILEWQRLVRLINARLDKQKTPASAGRGGAVLCAAAHIFAGSFMVA